MFLDVLVQVIILFILILIGVILTKCKLLNETTVKGMTEITLLIVTPCVIIKSFVREFDKSVFKNLIISFLIAFLAHLGFIILARLLIHSKEKSSEKVLRFAVVFSNCGFMSIPLQQAILGDTGVFYGSSYIAIFNLFIWSYGVISMSGDKKYLTPKKLILNPGIIGISIGLVIFLLSLPVPKLILEPINYMAGLNTPVPMIIIGYHLTNSNLLGGFKNLKLMFAIFLKLLLFPLAALGIIYLCGVRGDMLVSSAISCSAPTAAMATMFSSKFSVDTPLSVNMVSLSTIFSILTMPVIITLAQAIA